MSELTTLQAAARCGVEPATIRTWVNRGLLKPCGMRMVASNNPTNVFDEAAVDAIARSPRRGNPQPRPMPPINRLSTVAPLPDATLPMGLKILMKLGRFRRPTKTCQNQHVQWDVPVAQPEIGGGVLLGEVLIGADWLRVYRHTATGVVYHQQAPWMDENPDWADQPQAAETLVLLEAA